MKKKKNKLWAETPTYLAGTNLLEMFGTEAEEIRSVKEVAGKGEGMSSWSEIAQKQSTATHFAMKSFIISAQISAAKNSFSSK